MHAPREKGLGYRHRWIADISMDSMAAGLVATLVAVPSPISASLSLGGAITLALTPVTFPAIWQNSRGRLLLLAILALVPIGWLVAQNSLLQDNGRAFSMRYFLYEAALPMGLLASVVGAYWCITRIGLQRFLFLAFSGLLATELFSLDGVNPWKYGLALPISLLAILLFARSRIMLGIFVAPILIAVSIAADFRSWMASLCIATVLAAFARSSRTQPSASRVLSLGLVTLAAVVVVTGIITQASTAGMLGGYLEQRTKDQLEASNGNLMLGGRPEWGAAIALSRDNPLGIGIGVTPSSEDYWMAIRGMPLASRGLQEISNVANAFRQGEVNFHSTFWTFWAIYGVAGVIFSILVLFYFAHAALVAVRRIGRPNLRAAATLLMLSAIWDTLFSPTGVAVLAIALAAALYISGKPNIAPIQTKDTKHESSSAHQRHHNHAQ